MPFSQLFHKLHELKDACPLKTAKVQQLGTVQNYVTGWYTVGMTEETNGWEKSAGSQNRDPKEGENSAVGRGEWHMNRE